MRGGKYSLFDAGTHVPFMIRWKGTISPSVSDALVCQIDFLASFAELYNIKEDVGQRKNLATEMSEMVKILKEEMEVIIP